MCEVVSFQGYRAHPDLHAFPTRRCPIYTDGTSGESYLASFNATGSPLWQQVSTGSFSFAWAYPRMRLGNGDVLVAGHAWDGSQDWALAAAVSEASGVSWGVRFPASDSSDLYLNDATELPGGDILFSGEL